MSRQAGPGGVPRSRVVGTACDSCRRRKLKCSGSQPCLRCHESMTYCSYGNTHARTTTTDYIRHLESRVAELESRLPATQRGDEPPSAPEVFPDSSLQAVSTYTTVVSDTADTVVRILADDYTSSIDGSEIYHGRFASLNVLRILSERCEDLIDIMAPFPSSRELAKAFEKNLTLTKLRFEQPMAFTMGLPDEAETRRLCYVAIEEALPCHECIDREIFFNTLHSVHPKASEDITTNDRAFLSLVFALLAFAKRYEADNHNVTKSEVCNQGLLQGWRFYDSSVELLDLDDVCSLDLIRAIIYQVLFVAASCALSRAYTRLSIGAATALRMELHVSKPSLSSARNLSGEQMFRRRQVFSVLYGIDTYLASTLGVPKLLTRVDLNQTLPLRNEDLHDQGKSFVRRNPHTPEAETLLAVQAMAIVAEILKFRDPMSRPMPARNVSTTSELTNEQIASLEAQLGELYESLPVVDQLPATRRAFHAQLVIRYAYAITQSVLYRPFLHHLTRHGNENKFSMDGYAYGSRCINAAMQLVWIFERLDQHKLLHESIWFYISSLAFAAMSLMYFSLGSPNSPTVEEAVVAVFKANALSSKMGKKNNAAQCFFEYIDTLLWHAKHKIQTRS